MILWHKSVSGDALIRRSGDVLLPIMISDVMHTIQLTPGHSTLRAMDTRAYTDKRVRADALSRRSGDIDFGLVPCTDFEIMIQM